MATILPVLVIGASAQRIVVDSGGATLPDWLSAIAAALAAATTLFLVLFAARQIKAMRQQGEIAREAAARQWYPLVYAHEGEEPGPDPDLGSNDHMGCFYYLRNEGLGPALNIEHGSRSGGAAGSLAVRKRVSSEASSPQRQSRHRETERKFPANSS